MNRHRLSPELHERLKEDKEGLAASAHYFVCVHWPSHDEERKGASRCYSTFPHSVTMRGHHYSGQHTILDFNGKSDKGFVMSSEHLIYGASSGFRIFDDDGFAGSIVRVVKERSYFPSVFFDAWVHFSCDAKEIESLRYGKWLFSGHATRIEMQSAECSRPVAKVWGGHRGVLVSKSRPVSKNLASVVTQVQRSA